MACAQHPDQPAADTCVNCGHFMCRFCAEDGVQQRCPACRASAQSEAASGGPLGQLHGSPVSLGALCRAAWSGFQREPVMLGVAAFVALLISGTLSIPEKLADRSLEQAGEGAEPGWMLIGLLIALGILQLAVRGALHMGQLQMGARVLAAQPVDGLSLLFSQWRKVPRYLASVLLAVGVLLGPAFVVVVALTVWAELGGYEPGLLYVAGGLALSPLVLWLLLPWLLLVPVFAFEEGVGPFAALRRAFALARHRRLLLLGVGGVCLGALLLGFLACCLGLIPAFAFIQLLLAATYLRLREEEQVQVL